MLTTNHRNSKLRRKVAAIGCVVLVCTSCLFPTDPVTQSQLIGYGYGADGGRTLYFTNCSDVANAISVEVGAGSDIGSNILFSATARDYGHGASVLNLDNHGDGWVSDDGVPPNVGQIWVRVKMVGARNPSEGVFNTIAPYPKVMTAKPDSPKMGVTAETSIEEFESRPCRRLSQSEPTSS